MVLKTKASRLRKAPLTQPEISRIRPPMEIPANQVALIDMLQQILTEVKGIRKEIKGR
jgi:hypothetical protein